MKVFISWSGEKSKKYAEALKEWLEQCIQSVEAFFSADDIEKGLNWNAKLSNELADTNFGIVCLTSENISAPWINFEAGALSKLLTSKVTMLLTDISISEIKGPLASFQSTKLEKNDLYKLIQSINNELPMPLEEKKLNKSFDAFYSDFETKIKKIETEKKIAKKDVIKKDINLLAEEILEITREISLVVNNPEKIMPEAYVRYILDDTLNNERKSIDNIELILTFASHFREVIIHNSDNEELFDLLDHFKFICFKMYRNNKNVYSQLNDMFFEINNVYKGKAEIKRKKIAS